MANVPNLVTNVPLFGTIEGEAPLADALFGKTRRMVLCALAVQVRDRVVVWIEREPYFA